MIRLMALWKNGEITNIGVFGSYFWAWRAAKNSALTPRLWIEDEKAPATLRGHS